MYEALGSGDGTVDVKGEDVEGELYELSNEVLDKGVKGKYIRQRIARISNLATLQRNPQILTTYAIETNCS